MIDLTTRVLVWAQEKNILEPNNAKNQRLKLYSEIGELADAILKKDYQSARMELGDCFVVWTILKHQLGINPIYRPLQYMGDIYDTIDFIVQAVFDIGLEKKAYTAIGADNLETNLHLLAIQLETTPAECLEMALNKIEKRTGKTVNGTFIKD